MALMKSQQVPSDAVILDENEATSYAWDLVSQWEKTSDIWALKYGSAVLGSINAFSGVLINNHYRQKLKLRNYGYMSSVIPISLMPGVMTALFHRHLISTELLLMKKDGCPICYELRSGAIQLLLGVAYPMVLGPTSAFMFANRYNTYRIPNIAQPKLLFQFLKKVTAPLSSTLVYLGAVQFVASSVVTYFEMKNNFTLRKKIIEIEEKVMREENQPPKY